jgi:CheY-like chemotaxis protein
MASMLHRLMIRSAVVRRLNLKVWMVTTFLFTSAHAAPRPLRVLIADDQELLSMQMEEYVLQIRSDAEVFTVTNGHDAIRELQQAEEKSRSFDLLISDISMPTDGFQVLKTLRSSGRFKALTILMNSSEHIANPGIITQILSRGANGYIAKPTTPATIQSAKATLKATIEKIEADFEKINCPGALKQIPQSDADGRGDF